MAEPLECGRNRVPCPSIEDYPICKPDDTAEAWLGLKRLSIIPSRDPTITVPFLKLTPPAAAFDEEGQRNPTEDDVGKVVSEGWLEKNGFMGVCRSGYINANEPYQWYVYQQHAGYVGKVVLFNEFSPSTHKSMDQTPVPMTAAEAFGLVRSLGLGIYDVACKEGQCAKEVRDEKDARRSSFRDGNYYFTMDSSRLTVMVTALADDSVKIEGVPDAKRQKLLAHVAALKLKADFPMENAILQRRFLATQEEDRAERLWTGRAQLVLTILLLAAIGYQPAKDVVAWWKGRVKKKDFGKMIREQIERDPKYQVLGRSREVARAWRMADRPSFHNLIIDAKFGAGKDKVVEAMGLDRARGSKAVPPQFRDAPWFEFSAAEYIAGTQYRGNVGDKVREIVKLAEKGPVIIYVSEIDKVMLHGAAKDTKSEETGGLLLGELARPDIRRNIMLIGTTSRLPEMYATYGDLSRRFNILEIQEFRPSEIADLLDGVDTVTKEQGFRAIQETEVYYGVKIPRGIIDLAVRLCEKYTAPERAFIDRQTGEQVFARFDTNLELIQYAGLLARDRGAAEVAEEDLIKAAEEFAGQSIDRGEIEGLRAVDADSLMIMTSERTRGDMGAEFARAFRVSEAFKGVFAGTPDTEVSRRAGELAEMWRETHVDQRARIVARGGGMMVGGVPVSWLLEGLSVPAQVCEAPEVPVFDGAEAMGQAAAPPLVVARAALERRLADMAALVTDPPTRLVLEQMLLDLETPHGVGRVHSFLTMLGNPDMRETGLTAAGAYYGGWGTIPDAPLRDYLASIGEAGRRELGAQLEGWWLSVETDAARRDVLVRGAQGTVGLGPHRQPIPVDVVRQGLEQLRRVTLEAARPTGGARDDERNREAEERRGAEGRGPARGEGAPHGPGSPVSGGGK